jgi:hypothetical protein
VKKQSLALSLIVALSAALAFAMLTRDHDWGDDFAAYILQAISITRGTVSESAARTASAMRQSSRFYGPTAAPWGFPALLAPWYLACGGLNIFCLKLINILFFALFLLAFFPFLARRLPPVDSILVLSILASSPVLLAFEDNVLSDITFLFFSTLSILLIDRLIVAPQKPQGSPVRNVWLGIVLVAAFFVRTNGILLVLTLFLTQGILYFRHRPRGRGSRRVFAIALIPHLVFAVLALPLLTILPGGEVSTLGHFKTLTFDKLYENFAAYIVLPSVFFWSLPFYDICYGALLPFFVGGAVLNHEKDFHTLTYIGLSALLFIIWPEQQGLRYLFPLLPFLIYFSYRGMQATAFGLTEQYRRAGELLSRALWMAILVSFALTSFRLARANLVRHRAPNSGPFEPVSAEMFEVIKTRTAPDSVIVFDKPRAMSLMTGRDTLLIDTCDQLGKGNFVVLRKAGTVVDVDQVQPADILTCNPSLTIAPMFENQKYVVYRITRNGTAP